MSSSRPALAVERRTITGKANAHLRREGRLPAVVYGHGFASTNVSVDAHEFALLRRRIGPNALVDLSIDGATPKPVLIHGIHVHPVSRLPLHVDLFVVKMTEEMTVDVPIHAVGTSEAVERHGGTLAHGVDHLKVRALPDHLPQLFEADVSVLVDFDAAIHVRDLAVPADVTLLTDPDEVVFHVLQPRMPEAPTAAEAAAAEAVSEAAAAAEVAPAAD